jgi:hypothetical protein
VRAGIRCADELAKALHDAHFVGFDLVVASQEQEEKGSTAQKQPQNGR